MFPKGQLGNTDAQVIEGFNKGTAHMAYLSLGHLVNLYGPLPIGAGPFVFRDFDHWQAFSHSDLYRELVEGFEKATGMKVLVDGNCLPANLPYPAEAIIRGDQSVPCISAASILAKVHRDALMLELDGLYPAYGFKDHKGYGTRRHLEALAQFGATPAHRRSFAPVRKYLARDA